MHIILMHTSANIMKFLVLVVTILHALTESAVGLAF